jgi:hypothetical protein
MQWKDKQNGWAKLSDFDKWNTETSLQNIGDGDCNADKCGWCDLPKPPTGPGHCKEGKRPPGTVPNKPKA